MGGVTSTLRRFCWALARDIAKTLITHRFPLDAVAEAFATAADRSSGSIKVVLEP